MQTWKRIESAPRRGTVWLYDRHNGVEPGHRGLAGEWWLMSGHRAFAPTYWMEYNPPEPPKGE